MKYKVGDKVFIKRELIPEHHYDGCRFDIKMLRYCGKWATITKVVERECDKKNRYQLSGCANWWWSSKMFVNSESSKSDFLINGNIIECRNGNRYIVNGSYGFNKNEYIHDIENRGGDEEWDVVAIYAFGQGRGSIDDVLAYPGALLWKEKSMKKELTISEIEKLLGYEVKIVKGDRECV